ncbi:TMEM175 family protein [Lacticaseibacillus hulanensis]|jgi:uncharacterized membrane protein|uniref:TMEM175 family protein n=1 Tax=Lacticaseibacillus hulanensis TaxID=2493111 RepID=UPI000FDC417B|nr:TMEM175 family protein [Lacticaseibacillus hulanensis]
MDMKKRLDAFADAVIAIILTIMVLELPIETVHGQFDYLALAEAVGVYAVSFCFVANIWYQHAIAMGEAETIKRDTIIWDLVLLFLLSLVPASTRAMTMIASNYTVMVYGILYLLVSIVLRVIVRHIVHEKYTEKSDMAKIYASIYGDHNLESWSLIAANIVLAYFFPRVAMVFFIVITVRSFFANSGEQSELEEAGAMTADGRQHFIAMSPLQKRTFMNALQRYMKQEVHDAGTLELAGANWDKFAQQMQKQFGIQPADLKKWLEQRRFRGHGAGGHNGPSDRQNRGGYHQQ